MNNIKLTHQNHPRNFRDFTYIYPVLSRRAEGVSIGVNLNINNACNWRCIYCQVDGLIRAKPSKIDLNQLESELDTILSEIVFGDFLFRYAPDNLSRLSDISISGNGEPTLSEEFLSVCKIIIKLKTKYRLDNIKIILITNGSNIKNNIVQDGLELINNHNGVVWFKVDSVTPNSIMNINQINSNKQQILHNLTISSKLCTTWIQSCFFINNKKLPPKTDVSEYLEFIVEVKYLIKGVLLYTIARTPALAEGKNLTPVSKGFFENMCVYLEKRQILVKYYI